MVVSENTIRKEKFAPSRVLNVISWVPVNELDIFDAPSR